MALSTAVTEHWGFGAAQLKKYNIEPYLLLHQAFSNALTEYKDFRLRAKSNPALLGQLPHAKEQAESTGHKFVGAVPQFTNTIEKLAGALSEARNQQLTQAQQADVRALAQFLGSTLKSLEHNYSFQGVVEGMIGKVEEETPLNILAGKGPGL